MEARVQWYGAQVVCYVGKIAKPPSRQLLFFVKKLAIALLRLSSGLSYVFTGIGLMEFPIPHKQETHLQFLRPVP